MDGRKDVENIMPLTSLHGGSIDNTWIPVSVDDMTSLADVTEALQVILTDLRQLATDIK